MKLLGLAIPALLLAFCVLWSHRVGGRDKVGQGFLEAGALFWSVLPNLLIGFSLAGFLTLMLPREMVARWLGEGTGFKGLLAGTAAGALTPGGPFTHFPILGSLLGKGAAIGPVSAYIAGWSLIGVHRIMIWEIPILGGRFVVLRVLACCLCPVLIGLATEQLGKLFR